MTAAALAVPARPRRATLPTTILLAALLTAAAGSAPAAAALAPALVPGSAVASLADDGAVALEP